MMGHSGITTSVSSSRRVGASYQGGPPAFVLRQPNMRLKLSALLLTEALCCLQFSTSAAA